MITVTINGTERVPVNKQSAIVTQQQEEPYEYFLKQNTIKVWDTPPPMYNKPPKIFFGKNLIGTRRGAMVIIGYYGSGKKYSQWVGKCACGRYEIRNGTAWRKGLAKDSFDACCRCKQIFHRQGMEV